MNNRDRNASLAWMLVAQFGFSLMNLCARAGASHATLAQLGTCRAAVGAAVALIVARLGGSTLRVRNRRAVFSRSLFGTLAMYATFHVLSDPTIPIGDFATITATQPILIALLAPFVLHERSPKALGWILALAFAGVVLVVGPQFHARLTPSLWALGAAGFSGIAMLTLRRVVAHDGVGESPEAVAFHFSLLATVAMGGLWLADPAPLSAQAVLPALGAGLSAGLAQVAMTRAYVKSGAAQIGAAGYANVLFSYLLGVTFLGEPTGWRQALGAAMVFAGGIWLVNVSPKPTPP